MAKKKGSEGLAALRPLDSAIDELNKTYGAGTIGRGNYRTTDDRISTSFIGLDVEMCGGVPRGRLGHVWGKKSSGKSQLAKRICGNVQKHCVCGAPMDFERKTPKCTRKGCEINHAMDAAWIALEGFDHQEWDTKLGLDTERLIVEYPECAENAIDTIQTFLSAHHAGLLPPGIIVLDSIGNLLPKDLLESSSEQRLPGTQASLATNLCKRVQALLNGKPGGMHHYSIVLFLNQARANMSFSGPRGPNEQPCGGYSLMHNVMYSIHLRTTEMWSYNMTAPVKGDPKKPAIGQTSQAYIDKSKVGPQRRACDISFYIDGPRQGEVEEMMDIVTYGVRYGVVNKAGGWHDWQDIKANGADNFAVAVQEAGRLQELRALVVETASKHIRDSSPVPEEE